MNRRVILIILLSFIASLQNSTASITGTCGENISYYLDDNGTLTLTGTGKMCDNNSNSPFYNNYNINKIDIEEGITYIGKGIFYLCRNLKEVNISNSVDSIGDSAFFLCI